MTYVCVDAGQTKTVVHVLDEEGSVLELWEEDPLSTPSKPGALDGYRVMVRGICEKLRRRLEDAEPVLDPRAVCFSVTGYLEGDGRIPGLVKEEAARTLPAVERVHVIPDYVGNWVAATQGKPGVVVISGGGAVAYGRDATGNAVRVGGWGHLLGDEGSGYWIGLLAIKAALRSWAKVSEKTGLERFVMERFRVLDDRGLVHRVYSGAISEADIARLVPLVASLARGGDKVSKGILDGAAFHLAEIAAAALSSLGELPVYLSGGVFAAPTMQERFERALADAGHATVVTTIAPDPLDGIFLVAREGPA